MLHVIFTTKLILFICKNDSIRMHMRYSDALAIIISNVIQSRYVAKYRNGLLTSFGGVGLMRSLVSRYPINRLLKLSKLWPPCTSLMQWFHASRDVTINYHTAKLGSSPIKRLWMIKPVRLLHICSSRTMCITTIAKSDTTCRWCP